MAKIDDFYGNINRQPVRDWGYDGTTNEIAADSDFMMDQSRIKTEPRWVDNPAYKKAVKKSERTGVMAIPSGVSCGKMVDAKVNVMGEIKRNMGKPIHGTVYRSEQKRRADKWNKEY